MSEIDVATRDIGTTDEVVFADDHQGERGGLMLVGITKVIESLVRRVEKYSVSKKKWH